MLPDSENLFRWLLISLILVQNRWNARGYVCLKGPMEGGDKSQQDILAVKGPCQQAWQPGFSLWRRVIAPQVDFHMSSIAWASPNTQDKQKAIKKCKRETVPKERITQ